MAKMLLTQATEYFQKKGDFAVTKNFLYTGCRTSTIPHMKIGNRYIVDTDELEEYFKKIQAASIKHEDIKELQFGKLRKIF